MSWTRITIIVTAARRASANILAAALDPDLGGAETFTAGYSPTSGEPATHYVSSGLYQPASVALLTGGDAAAIHAAAVAAAAARGREYTQTENAIALVLATAIITTDAPELAIAAAGLLPVVTYIEGDEI